MLYYKTKDENGLWILENTNDWKYVNKTESVFTTANGYMGVRATHAFRDEERCPGMFVAGLYQKATEYEVTELVNCPDATEIRVEINNEIIRFSSCAVEGYERKYNTKTGEVIESGIWKTREGISVKISIRAFASLFNRHFWCQKMELELLDKESARVSVEAGINGQITNSGTSHFINTECRVYDKKIMHYKGIMDENKLDIYEDIKIKGLEDECNNTKFVLKRRSIYQNNKFVLKKGQIIKYVKMVYVTKDNDDIKNHDERIELIKSVDKSSYMSMLELHKMKSEKFWKYAQIDIDGISKAEEAAIKYSQYQLYGMTPYNTDKVSIGAKGLTGEGYKGHVFWDTEIYMLPFYCYTYPNIAKNMLIYRYNGLAGAQKKAKKYGYEGALYPWESALDGEEETPKYAALNIHTGKANKVWSGIKEHHISADVAYAVIKYYEVTGDSEFMEKYGMEMLIEICKFWCTRTTYKNGRLEILDIIGPDEYNEHIDNNAYTNYLVKYITDKLLEYLKQFKENNKAVYEVIDSKLCINEWKNKFVKLKENIYLPKPNENGIIPQDDTFLEKPEIANIDKYKNSPIKQSVLLDFSRDEVVEMQVLKQADTVMLLNLFPTLLEPENVKKNVLFYEARTLHDSSLSYCSHAQACANIGELEMSKRFFEKALETDLCDNPYDSRDGLHAASLGGIWNCLIQGYAGFSINKCGIQLIPHLPKEWKSISFYFCMNGKYHNVKVTDRTIEIKSEDYMNDECNVSVFNNTYKYKNEIIISY